MSEVTAEMIERGRGAERRRSPERRRVSRKVQEAREKLTSSGRGDRSFGIDLLRLYAKRRKGAAPGAAIVGIGLAIIAAHWTSLTLVLGWLAMDGAAILLAFGLADWFLSRSPADVRLRPWTRAFVAAETIQGSVWALIVLATGGMHDPQIATVVLIAMLLVAAMNASVTASIFAAVCGALMPVAIAIAFTLRPRGPADSNLLLLLLALGTLLYFAYLARKLRDASLQALVFQAEKDDLIAELEQSKANSDLARLRAEESNLAKSRFLATMSHELRTPLNAILGFSDIMKGEAFGRHAVPAYKDYARDIHASGEHLLGLINGILDLSRVEAGCYELQEESIDLSGIIDDCTHLVALRAQKKNIVIRQQPAEALPPIWGDTRAVRQIVLNLLSNAIKFTPPGGRVSLRLGATSGGGQFFSIADTGTGIPDHEIPVVMASFGRGTFAQKTAEEGTGLGLPIVRGLVELHGGTFDLQSKVREGTAVTVCFPSERVMLMPPRTDGVTEAAITSFALRPAA